MRRLLLLLLLAASVAAAASFTSASCSFGAIAQPITQTGQGTDLSRSTYYVTYPNGDSLSAEGVTGASVSGTQGRLDGDVDVTAQFNEPITVSFDVQAVMDNSLSFATGGPKRAGFIQIDFQALNLFNIPGTLSISDGPYSYQVPLGTTTLPFELGSVFQARFRRTRDLAATASSIRK